ncbi:hypothetical protein [Membranihabitans marinus]|uniref:hypothetical protein n=1 Tax=Membranihabitans marinus TaxID=1227546 RepID=UPI001F317298|nr:hypothetical protein [Membranihabitans marinus]
MKKNQKTIIVILANVALLGYLLCSIYVFYMAFSIGYGKKELPQDYLNQINEVLMYFNNGLTGMVGGIVASGFGIPTAVDSNHRKTVKLTQLGNMISSNFEDPTKERLGFYYALTYIVFGIASILVWIILQDSTLPNITHMATTFFGMLMAIVVSYFGVSN